MTKTFADGGIGKYEMVVKRVKSQVRYSKIEDKLGDYFVINENGDLAWGDKDEGLWATSKKIK